MPTQLVLSDLLEHSAALYPKRPAIVCGDRRLTYAELLDRTARFAGALRGMGVGRGDRIAVLAENTVEYAEIYFGAATAGCACVPINYRLTPAEALGILADASPRLLICDPRLEQLGQAIVAGGFASPVVSLGGEHRGAGSYEAMLAQAMPATPTCDAADIALQMYTSGATGRPKGAMLSHRNLIANSWSMLVERNVVREDVLLVPGPLCHLGAGSRIISIVHASATLVVLPAFDPDRIVRMIGSGEVTSAMLVPTMVRGLVEALRATGGPAVGRFRRLTYGGSPIPLPVLKEALQLLSCEFQHGYGLTEASPNLTYLQPEDHEVGDDPDRIRRLESVGRETTGVVVRLVDDEGNLVAPGTPGEVVARGPNVMEGYWNDPAATAETLRGGWLHTGDVGVKDDAGYLFLVDRKKDMLISGGLNVYPREIEARLEQHPHVAEVAVIARPDERWGEVPVAFVVPAPVARGIPYVERELRTFVAGSLATYKHPKEYRFVASLPRNAVGKVLKLELRRQMAAEVG